MRALRLASVVATARPPADVRAFASSVFARISFANFGHNDAAVSSVSSSSSDDDAPSVGTTYSTRRTFTQEDVSAFAALTGDSNPIHRDQDAAVSAGFTAPVVHGMLCASLFSAIIGSRFPGAVYATQTLKFRAPVLIGESVTAEVILTKLTRSRASFETKVTTENGATAVDGAALAMLPSADDPGD
jgi:3-hydroxybutyryl-CoA dehydratase|tara:strand:+ start:3717 stop:4277 length:561 start_codon:yes stop_codon:yes gene_type:complete